MFKESQCSRNHTEVSEVIAEMLCRMVGLGSQQGLLISPSIQRAASHHFTEEIRRVLYLIYNLRSIVIATMVGMIRMEARGWG